MTTERQHGSRQDAADSAWRIFDVEALKEAISSDGVRYREFLRVPTLSCGVYHLPAGAEDMQRPHDEDEVYYVLAGKARVKVGDELKAVHPGTVLYIRATETHSFFEIEEDMTLLVLFASTR